ncbi:tetratricopeptide repeat protein [Sanguibacter suaedae]|uniref:Tetratricopeptide repeat protein n=1 Tax=Sanguibacter suaedae TaxID=2795737 RepID=A0A934I7Y3_9MICO|nr:tetratricopeptide repeat protein [Sanguibacter suaedae]MBI9115891.1 tetratricopeptide repeat protein [Sanguibacter suaedae]
MADEIDGVVYRAESFLALGRSDRAETLVREALAQAPRDARLLLALARVLDDQERWSDVLTTTEAALVADPDLVPAHILRAWAAYRLQRWDVMDQHVSVVLAREPENPVAHMCRALSGLRDTSPAGRVRVRESYLLALEYSGGAAWFVRTAAEIEVHLGNTAEARRLVDEGLERFPTDTGLLMTKAGFDGTPTEESLDIVSGMLAGSPTDPRLQAMFDSVVSRRRRRLLTMLWFMPVLLALGCVVPGGGFRAAWVALVLVAGFLVFGVRSATLERLPDPVREELASRAPWRLVTRYGATLAVVAGAGGGVVLSMGGVFGAWGLVVAVLAWAATRAAGLGYERAQARRADDAIAAESGADRGSRAGPLTSRLVRERFRHAFVVPVLLLPLVFVALFPGASPEDEAARSAIGVIAAVVALVAVAEAVVLTASVADGPSARGVLLVVVPVLLAGALLVTSTGGVADAVREWGAQERSRTPLVVPSTTTFDPDRFTPRPAPTVSIPTFEFQEFPEIPDLGVPEG